jgi:hypothetical protein
LWHHQQASGQPFMKTVVRIPGPSCVEKRMMLKIAPESEPPFTVGINSIGFSTPPAIDDVILN